MSSLFSLVAVPSKYTVLDLFCGCGGLSLGFMHAGFDVVAGIDHWSDALTTFTATHPGAIGIQADLFTQTPAIIADTHHLSTIDVIIGDPPCQGFSIAGKRMIDDPRNQLYRTFVEFVRYYQPQAFLMENVSNVMSMASGSIKEAIIADFTALGYQVSTQILIASDYGVPQNRHRAFFVGVKGT